MREIKFRAWDKETKEIRRITRIDFAEWSVNTESKNSLYEIGDRNSFKNEETDRCILMQYTGLKDKNNAEIYEGDIIEAKRHSFEEEDIGVIIYKPMSYLLKIYKKNRTYIAPRNYHNIFEVIGNIYENPELLESLS